MTIAEHKVKIIKLIRDMADETIIAIALEELTQAAFEAGYCQASDEIEGTETSHADTL